MSPEARWNRAKGARAQLDFKEDVSSCVVQQAYRRSTLLLFYGKNVMWGRMAIRPYVHENGSMVKERDKIKVLFLQVRDDEMKEHEFLCFDNIINIPQENFIRVDVFRDPLDASILNGIDAVILSGTGHYFNGGGHPTTLPALIDLIKEIRHQKIPMLAIGYGHQVVAIAFDGVVVQDPALREIGVVEMTATVDGAQDPIFSHLPEKFIVQIGHNHSVTVGPEGAVDLVGHHDDCCEAFLFPEEKIYALQFHPELERKDAVIRLTYYKRKYFDQVEELDKIISELQDSSEAIKIPDLFISEVVCK